VAPNNKILLFVELFIVSLIFIGEHFGFVPVSSTLYLLPLGWLSLRLRRLGWRNLGLKHPAKWSRTLLIGFVGGILFQCISLYLVEPLIAKLTGKLPDVSLFKHLLGNVEFLLLSLVVAWTLAAFGEEMVYRGYLLNRMADLLGGKRGAWIISLLLTSILFGLAHLYQGISGVIATGLSGLVFGAFYLADDRNLWPAIIAHGVYDTVGFIMIFLGIYPGL
jgi:uncharacterized protein